MKVPSATDPALTTGHTDDGPRTGGYSSTVRHTGYGGSSPHSPSYYRSLAVGGLPMSAVGAQRLPVEGWVTAIKHETRYLTAVHEQLDAGERQRHLTLWSRRKAIDKLNTHASSKAKADAESSSSKSFGVVAQSQAQELSDDPKGVAFAFGSVEPGMLHARGQVVKTHTVRYSIGLAGRYRLHVGLRQQAVAIPGSPFLLTVSPGASHAPSTRLRVEDLPLQGTVGTDEGAGCTTMLQTSDRMGNNCTKGGSPVQVATCECTHECTSTCTCTRTHTRTCTRTRTRVNVLYSRTISLSRVQGCVRDGGSRRESPREPHIHIRTHTLHTHTHTHTRTHSYMHALVQVAIEKKVDDSPLQVEVIDQANGSYKLFMKSELAGSYQIKVTIQGPSAACCAYVHVHVACACCMLHVAAHMYVYV